jgi:hypothetical protein
VGVGLARPFAGGRLSGHLRDYLTAPMRKI